MGIEGDPKPFSAMFKRIMHRPPRQYAREAGGTSPRQAAGYRTTLILVAAPAAESHYPRIGMKPHPSCWILPRAR
jgi:hypothetical protein